MIRVPKVDDADSGLPTQAISAVDSNGAGDVWAFETTSATGAAEAWQPFSQRAVMPVPSAEGLPAAVPRLDSAISGVKRSQPIKRAESAATHQRNRRPVELDDDVRPPRFTVRAAAFTAAFLLLLAAVPALGITGERLLLNSQGGNVHGSTSDPSEAGFLASIDPTPTALAIQRGPDDEIVSASLIALGAKDGGGTVIMVPLHLEANNPKFFKTVIQGYEQIGDEDAFERSVADAIGVAIEPPLIELTDQSLATLVGPIAPIAIELSEPLDMGDGIVLNGDVQLTAEQVGPFLRARRGSESELAVLERQRQFWTAWLDAIAASPLSEPIGAAATGLGSFLSALGEGQHEVQVLDVQENAPDAYGQTAYSTPGVGMTAQIIQAIPSPSSPRPGLRPNVKLLNGYVGKAVPTEMINALTIAGGSVVNIGNARKFGQVETLIEYSEPSWKDEAKKLATVLGPSAKIKQMSARQADSESLDMVISVGKQSLASFGS